VNWQLSSLLIKNIKEILQNIRKEQHMIAYDELRDKLKEIETRINALRRYL
jgi:hypothetical protein